MGDSMVIVRCKPYEINMLQTIDGAFVFVSRASRRQHGEDPAIVPQSSPSVTHYVPARTNFG